MGVLDLEEWLVHGQGPSWWQNKNIELGLLDHSSTAQSHVQMLLGHTEVFLSLDPVVHHFCEYLGSYPFPVYPALL
jgi:hypothetical protein